MAPRGGIHIVSDSPLPRDCRLGDTRNFHTRSPRNATLTGSPRLLPHRGDSGGSACGARAWEGCFHHPGEERSLVALPSAFKAV